MSRMPCTPPRTSTKLRTAEDPALPRQQPQQNCLHINRDDTSKQLDKANHGLTTAQDAARTEETTMQGIREYEVNARTATR